MTLVEWRPSLSNSSHVPLLLGAYSATRSKSGMYVRVHTHTHTHTHTHAQTGEYSTCCSSMKKLESLLRNTGWLCIFASSFIVVIVLLFFTTRPLLWGPAAIEHYRQKQEVGWLLWKQPGMLEVVGQLKRDVMYESIYNFPLETNLNVSGCMHSLCNLGRRVELRFICLSFLFILYGQLYFLF